MVFLTLIFFWVKLKILDLDLLRRKDKMTELEGAKRSVQDGDVDRAHAQAEDSNSKRTLAANIRLAAKEQEAQGLPVDQQAVAADAGKYDADAVAIEEDRAASFDQSNEKAIANADLLISDLLKHGQTITFSRVRSDYEIAVTRRLDTLLGISKEPVRGGDGSVFLGNQEGIYKNVDQDGGTNYRKNRDLWLNSKQKALAAKDEAGPTAE